MTTRPGILQGFLLTVAAVVLVSCEHEDMSEPVPAIPVHTYGATPGNGSLGTHTVHTGETVWMISQRYNLALRDILDSNRLTPPYALNAGQRLNLPAPQTYKIRPGDSLYAISRLFNTSTTELVALNKLKTPYRLAAGDTLRLPPRYQRVRALPVAMPVRGGIDPVPSATGVGRASPELSKNQPYIPPPSSPDEYRDDRPTETAKATPASAVAQVMPKTPAREGRFIKPVKGKVISGYGPKRDGLHNDGVNIQAARGEAVRAAENGVIAYTGDQIGGYGNLILVRHGDGYVTAYAHLDRILVKRGDSVRRGQTIGTVGSTGSVDKPQLHFEIRKGTKALDPAGQTAL